MKILTRIAILFFLFGFYNVSAQTNKICGKIIDAKTKQAIADANIWIENSINGTTSDTKGNFCLSLNNKTKQISLLFSHLGFKTLNKKISVSEKTNLTIALTPSTVELNEVVVRTNKNSTSTNEQTVTSIIISKDLLFETTVHNIPDILLKQPGVSLAGQAYHAAPSIRGLARKRVVVMADREKVSSERNIGAPGTFINPFEIERIEILKGPYSTLYGSDAVGGVVNIITKNYDQPYYLSNIGGLLNISYQSVSNAKNVNLSVNGSSDNLLYRISAGYRDADNYSIPNGNDLMNSFYSEKHVAGKIMYSINDNHELTAKGYYSKGGEIGKPAYDTLTNAIHDIDNHFIVGLNYKWKGVSKYLTKTELNITAHKHELGAKINKHKVEIDPSEDKFIKNKKNLWNTDYITQYDLYFTLSDRLKVLAGFDGYFRQDIHLDEHKVVRNYNTGIFIKKEEAILLDNGFQNSYGVYTQADYLFTDRLFINAGLRWNFISTGIPDDPEKDRTDNSFNGNFGLSYNFANKFTIKVNIGSAFRAPDIKELYVTTNTPGGLNISNPDLVSEHSFNFDLGFVYNSSSNLIELSLFRNQIKNMVILDWDNTTAARIGEFKNIGEGLLYGGEISYNQKLSECFSSMINLTKIYGFDKHADDELMDVPPLQLNASFKYSINQFWAKLSGRYSGKQTEVAEDDFTNKAFTTFDFGTGWKVMENLNAIFTITNILDEKYREHFQFNWMYAPGRSFNLSLNFNI